jgi:protein involved in polysaccharide export with SLBB domain
VKRFLLYLLIAFSSLSLCALAQETGGSNNKDTSSGGEEEFTFEQQPTIQGMEDYLPGYPLSVGDSLTVNIYTPTPMTLTAIVDRNGFIVIPPAGRIQVLGLTIEDASARVEHELSPYYNQVSVSIEPLRLSKVKVFVFGATDRAGVYQLRGGTTMLEFLQLLKLKSWGQYRQIHHYRFASYFLGDESGTQEDTRFSHVQPADAEQADDDATPVTVQDLMSSADSESDLLVLAQQYGARDTIVDPTDFVALGELKSKNFLLRDGDIIYFQLPGKSVSVYGTTRPGIYEVLPGEGLVQVMRRAGDATPENDLRNTLIERLDAKGGLAFQIVDLDKYYFSQDVPPVIPLENGDRVKVIPFEQSVTVIGAVNEAGRIEYNAQYSVLDYIAAAGGGRADAQREKIFIVRGSWQPGGAFEMRESVVVNADEYIGGALKQLPPVYPGDVIYVPTKDELAKRDLASILTSISLTAISVFKK